MLCYYMCNSTLAKHNTMCKSTWTGQVYAQPRRAWLLLRTSDLLAKTRPRDVPPPSHVLGRDVTKPLLRIDAVWKFVTHPVITCKNTPNYHFLPEF